MNDVDNTLNRETLLHQIEAGWNELQTYVASVTEEQLTGATDAVGWTAKDHLMHIAKWEQAGIALLNKGSKREVLDIPPETWAGGDDPTNAVIQERYRHMPLSEVLEFLRQTHERMLSKLDSMTDEELLLPYNYFQSTSTYDRPIFEVVIGDTVDHYREHLPWMAAIVEEA